MKSFPSFSRQGSFFHIIPSFRVLKPFWIEVSYFMILSLLGFLALNVSKPRSFRPPNLDVFFTSVSASTVASMSTVEMEVFSDEQLVFMTLLMFLGGEAFTSFLRLQLVRLNIAKEERAIQNVELGTVKIHHIVDENGPDITKIDHQPGASSILNNNLEDSHETTIKLKSITFLSYVIIGYIAVVILVGSSLVSIYINLIPSAKQVLEGKGLNLHIFSLFTCISTFVNCGFIPTNENMMVFKRNSGLLLVLIPQSLLGNTLYAPALRSTVWCLWKITKRAEFAYILNKPKQLGYCHIFPSNIETISLAVTVVELISIQFAVFCGMEWNSEATGGLNIYEKVVASLFQVVNTRHAGESLFDLSTLTPAIIVLFAFMMYLPPYTSYLPMDSESSKTMKRTKERRGIVEYISLSQLSYLVIFTILICITERDKMKNDPLNFNVLNIVFEVISANGTVGLSMGYSCARQLHPDGQCKDAMYGFAGKWSNTGKFILIIVMFFGRLKMYNTRGGKAWKVL